MDYIAIDTNIFISMCLKRIDSVTAPCLEAVKNLLNENKIRLVLPDIIITEFKRNLRKEIKASQDFFSGLIKNLDRAYLPFDTEEAGYPLLPAFFFLRMNGFPRF